MEVAYRPAVCRDNDVACEHVPGKVELGEVTSSYRVSEPPRRLCAARDERLEERLDIVDPGADGPNATEILLSVKGSEPRSWHEPPRRGGRTC